MSFKLIKNELQNIISGKSNFSDNSAIQSVTNYLRTSERTSPLAEEKHKNKGKETESLIKFAESNNLFYQNIDTKNYISEGAEQKVYIKNQEFVLKLNDAIYYASWEDYFNNLLIHNYFFADTAYHFLGFYLQNSTLYAVVQQPFVKADELTDLTNVQTFLINNGFLNTRNNDYYHPEIGIILEDLHNENVLTKQNMLYFINTFFYINQETFWTN